MEKEEDLLYYCLCSIPISNSLKKNKKGIEIMKCIHIGLLCVQENVVKRPTMASVVLMLNTDSMTLSIPSRPAFIMNSNTRSNVSQVEHNSRVIGPDQYKHVEASLNEVSIIELRAR